MSACQYEGLVRGVTPCCCCCLFTDRERFIGKGGGAPSLERVSLPRSRPSVLPEFNICGEGAVEESQEDSPQLIPLLPL